VGDEVRLYYGGANYTHGTPYLYRAEGTGRQTKFNGSTGLATWKLDRFVSVDGPAEGGTLTTAPVRFKGKRLEINAAMKAGGQVVVELLDAAGRPIRGFEPSAPFSGDDLRHTVRFVAEKFVPINDYGGGNGADDTGPMEGVDPDTICSSATCQDFSFAPQDYQKGAPDGPLSNPHQDINVSGWSGTGWSAGFQFGSAHPAGMNAVFADGSVHSIKYGIDPEVFNALGNMDDGTTLHSDPDNIQ
jgi:prepilin-type processing-associated H-X9-DG protein